jgi:hypothetical protein
MKRHENRAWRRLAWPAIALALCAAWARGAEIAPAKISQAQLNGFKVMNYYPAKQVGPNMWLHWDPNPIKADFDKMAAMHVNVVRLLLPPSAFGYPDPSPKMMNELREAVDMAAQKGMRVHFTLFFMWTHSYADIAGSKTWAKAVLAPFAHDSRVAFIELHNEIKPEKAAEMSWARTMLPYLRTAVEGSIPVTVSVTGDISTSLSKLISELGLSQPDFYDVHLYNYADYEPYHQLKAAKDAATAQGRALLIGETSRATLASKFAGFPSFARAQASYEAWQDYHFRLAFLASSALGLPPVAPWIFSDFAPDSLAGITNKEEPSHKGIYRADGSPKAAVATVSAFFGSGQLDTSFNNGFERYDLSEGRNQPELWAGDTPSEATYEDDTTVSHSGCCSAKISNSGASKGNPGFYITPLANIVPESSYTASVWVKGQNATGTTQICINWLPHGRALQRGGVAGTLACGGSLSGTTSSWKRISVTSVAPEGTAAGRIFLQSGHNTGAAWFDDVTFK